LILGESPYLFRQSTEPLPDDETIFPFDLMFEPITKSSLGKYVFVESPENPFEIGSDNDTIFQTIVSEHSASNRVGMLYYLIAAIFGTEELLAEQAKNDSDEEAREFMPWFEIVKSVAERAREEYGEDNVHLTDEDFENAIFEKQASDDVWDRTPENGQTEVFVDKIESENVGQMRLAILRALARIGIQGEGIGHATSMGDVDSESHFIKFFERYKTIADGDVVSSPVPRGAVIGIGDNEGEINHPEAKLWAELGNLRYALMIGLLAQYYQQPANDRQFLGGWIFCEMFHLRRISGFLNSLPLRAVQGDPAAAVAALPLTMPPDDEMSITSSWSEFHAERYGASIDLVDQLLEMFPEQDDDKNIFLREMKAPDERRLAESLARQNGETVRTEFDQVREHLNWASGSGVPPNAFHSRFWNLSLIEFKDHRLFEGDPPHFLERLDGGGMPQGRKQLEANEVGRQALEDVKQWVADGANERPLSDL